jgi:hypothetical protein
VAKTFKNVLLNVLVCPSSVVDKTVASPEAMRIFLNKLFLRQTIPGLLGFGNITRKQRFGNRVS